MVQYYNKRNFPGVLPTVTSPEPQHRRTESTSAVMLEDPALHAHAHSRHPQSSDSDVFPPRSSSSSSPGTGVTAGMDLPYNPDGMIEYWLHEYEAVLNEVFGEKDPYDSLSPGGMGINGRADDPAWNRLDEIMRSGGGRGGQDDEISDSESVVSVGELGPAARIGVGITPSDTESESDDDDDGSSGSRSMSAAEDRRSRDLARQQRRQSGNENTWEHMSPTTLSLLPRSPADRRRSSSSSSSGERGSPLRAVQLGSSITASDMPVFEDEDIEIPGPMPILRENDGDGDGENQFGAVDEVEYAYGE